MVINASAELSVLQAVAQFLTYAVMAVFAENAVFFRAGRFPTEQAGQRPQNQHMAVLHSHHSGTDHQCPHGLGCPKLNVARFGKGAARLAAGTVTSSFGYPSIRIPSLPVSARAC